MQQGFPTMGFYFFFFFFGSNWGGKEGDRVMGVIRREEFCCLSQSQADIPIHIQNLPYIEIYNPRGSPSLLIAGLKTRVWCIPGTKRALNFHQDARVGVAGHFDANPAVAVSKSLVPLMLPGCK